jgi:hypothetical protein
VGAKEILVLMCKSHRLATVAAVLAVLATGCQSSSSDPEPDPAATGTATASATAPEPDVGPFESGPESPLGYGLEVPDGATQLGPLTRIRSDRLIAAYAPDLQAAEASRAADAREKLADAQAEDPAATMPTPAPDDRPSDDSFRVLDEQPRPDTVVSVMRIDGKPTQVVGRMLAQLDAMLPDSTVPRDLSSWCESRQQRISGCRLGVSGTTRDDREVRIVLTVDPGNVTTRTAPPSSMRQPVMTLQLKYVGDPRAGQAERETDDIGDVDDVEDAVDPAGLIWPAMDLDAGPRTPLADGFVPPADATVLLSGFDPSFVELTTDKAADADDLARQWVADRADSAVTKDVAVELNEVSTTYSGSKDDTFYRATYVLSARGNYVLLMVYPPGYTH